MASFKCAANALDNIVENECNLADEKAMVICTLEAYNKEPNTVYASTNDKYYEDLYVIYETWKGYRTYTAS